MFLPISGPEKQHGNIVLHALLNKMSFRGRKDHLVMEINNSIQNNTICIILY